MFDTFDVFLHDAARSGHLTTIVLLLDKGVDVNSKDRINCTALHLAAYHGYAECVELLLARGADVDAVTCYGWTPLHCAAAHGHVHCGALLLARGASIGASGRGGRTPLYIAAKSGHAAFARMLLDSGAAVDSAKHNGATPLTCAVKKQHLACAQLLLERGCAMDAATAASLATQAAASPFSELVLKLLWRGVHVVAPDAAADEDAAAATHRLRTNAMLTAWEQGELRAWRRDAHAMFPAAFRADVAAFALARRSADAAMQPLTARMAEPPLPAPKQGPRHHRLMTFRVEPRDKNAPLPGPKDFAPAYFVARPAAPLRVASPHAPSAPLVDVAHRPPGALMPRPHTRVPFTVPYPPLKFIC